MLHPIGKIQPLLIGWNLPDEVESMLVGEWVWVSTEVTWVLSGVVATDSHAELVDVWTVAGRRAWIVSNGPPDAGHVRACSYVVLHRLGSIALAGRRCNAP